MSDETTTNAAPETESPEKASRERRTFPVRLFEAGHFDTIAKAERWVQTTGADNQTYMMARVIGASKVLPRRVEEVTL
jgi:hypothetical protein